MEKECVTKRPCIELTTCSSASILDEKKIMILIFCFSISLLYQYNTKVDLSGYRAVMAIFINMYM